MREDRKLLMVTLLGVLGAVVAISIASEFIKNANARVRGSLCEGFEWGQLVKHNATGQLLIYRPDQDTPKVYDITLHGESTIECSAIGKL